MEGKGTLSKKKEADLYKSVSDDIMDTRIDLQRALSHIPNKDLRLIDDITFNLSVKCPQKAIELFKKKK